MKEETRFCIKYIRFFSLYFHLLTFWHFHSPSPPDFSLLRLVSFKYYVMFRVGLILLCCPISAIPKSVLFQFWLFVPFSGYCKYKQEMNATHGNRTEFGVQTKTSRIGCLVAKVQVAAHKYSWKIFKSCIWNIFQRNAVGDF